MDAVSSNSRSIQYCFPDNFTMLAIDQYRTDVEALIKLCGERGIATQTIKSAARRRWQNDNETKIQLV
jgi:hypothetical protein